MINQMMCGILVVATAEGLALAAKSGADPKVVYDVIKDGAARSFVWEDRVPAILAGDYSPKGVVEIFTKDLGIALDGAKDVSFPAPLTAAAMQQFLAAAAMGHGRDSDAAVVKVYEALAGVDVAAVARKSR
jgi:3-hydroxyisobutyrate dehydrogenase